MKDKNNINKIYKDSAKTTLVDNQSIEAYNQFSFTKYIENTIQKVQKRNNIYLKQSRKSNGFNNKETVELVSIKFTPNKNYEERNLPAVTVSLVLKHTIELDKNSNLARLIENNQQFMELGDKQKNDYIQKYFPHDYQKKKIASIDLGLVNHAAMTFNYRKKGIIIASRKYNQYIANKNKELDSIKSKLLPQAVKDIQSKYNKEKDIYFNQKEAFIAYIITQNPNLPEEKLKELIHEQLEKDFNNKNQCPVLSKADSDLLKQSIVQLYSNKEYVNHLQKINHYKDNYNHQLTTKILDICASEGIDYLIIGKNQDWKTGLNMGRRNNSAMYNIAHTKLINYLKYKALKYGIVVLTVT